MKQALNFPDYGSATPGSLRQTAKSSTTPDDSEKCTDDETPWLNHRLTIRLFQADYEYMHADWGLVSYGGRANINAARLSAGIVIHASSIAAPAHSK